MGGSEPGEASTDPERQQELAAGLLVRGARAGDLRREEGLADVVVAAPNSMASRS
jgi:hypothetical protein